MINRMRFITLLLALLWMTLATTARIQAAPPTQDDSPQQATGTICINAFLDEDGNGLHEGNEGYVTDVTLTVAQGFNIVGQAVSTGTILPVCFSGLIPGEYQVAQIVPPVLEMTTQANITVKLGENETAGLEFGSRLRGQSLPPANGSAAPETAPPTLAPLEEPESDSGVDWAVIVGLSAIVLGVLMLGLLVFALLRR